MTTARFATPDDIEEIARLRQIMLEGFVECPDNGWKEATAAILKRHSFEAEPTMAVFVVDAPDAPGVLAACATGIIQQRLPSPLNHSGLIGWIFNVSTDPGYRRRGYSRTCMDALLAWYRERGILWIELLASEAGEGLYEQFGFKRSSEPAMRLLNR